MRPIHPLLAALLVSACQPASNPTGSHQPADNRAPEESVRADHNAEIPVPAPESEPAPPEPSDPGPTPAELTKPAAAVAVLQAYCDAIADKDYGAAYRAWGDDGKRSGMSPTEFADSLRKYDAFDCSFSAPLDAEGAAGSIYLQVPAVITGTLASGGGFHLRGRFTMRRVNDVPGSTAQQRRWHIESSDLNPRP